MAYDGVTTQGVFYLRAFAVADADYHQASAAIMGVFEHASEEKAAVMNRDPRTSSPRIRVRQ